MFSLLGWSERRQFLDYFPSSLDWLEDMDWVWRQYRANIFKRIQAPPIIVLSKRAFGFDLRESQLPVYEPRIYKEEQERLSGMDLSSLV